MKYLSGSGLGYFYKKLKTMIDGKAPTNHTHTGYASSTHSHTANQITQDTTHRFVTDDEKSSWNSKASESHYHSISNITGLQGEIDSLKKSVSDGKTKVANAITNKGVPTSATATFDTMATNISNIQGDKIMFTLVETNKLHCICKDENIASVSGSTLIFKPYKKFSLDGTTLNITD